MITLVTSDQFREHRPPAGHPERPERADVMLAVVEAWRAHGADVVAPREATRDELLRVHLEPHLDLIAGTGGRSVGLDPDTFTSPRTHEVALLAAGAALTAVERVMADDRVSPRAFALVRPPGHHAEPNRAMGFCFYNNAAVAAAHALTLGAARVAVVDYDVHHGNGTQWAFYDDPRVLYVSTHQFPFYPGTGAAGETGRGDGTGFTVNVPLEAGATDADYVDVFERLVVPVLDQFGPDLLIVSAGFDAHDRDPLAGMHMSADGYAALTVALCALSDRACRGRLVAVTEGGYDLDALGDSLEATIASMSGLERASPAGQGRPTRRAAESTAAVQAAHAASWQF